MGGAFAIYSEPHHWDFVCASYSTVEHLPPSKHMWNVRQILGLNLWVGGGGGGGSALTEPLTHS